MSLIRVYGRVGNLFNRRVTMFLKASGLIYERLHLVTFGATCRYAISAEDGGLTLTDPGASIHVAALEERLTGLKLSLRSLRQVLITHLDADRIGGIPLLRRLNPKLKVYGTAAMHTALANEKFVRKLYEHDQRISSWFKVTSEELILPFEEFRKSLKIDKHLVETDSIEIDEDVTIRSLATPGHRPHSVSYLVVPHEFAIVDETFGYFHGRNLAAPGGDTNAREAITSLKKFNDIQLSGIGFSYGGAITGALVKRHLQAIAQNTEDLFAEVAKARKDGFSEPEIEEQVRTAFYTSERNDPCLQHSLDETFKAVMSQTRSFTS
jgi:glyoxylase-like metal-dependent hydrolase (beta-lactamase superfamily II)